LKAVQTALNGAIASGDYGKVLNRWGKAWRASAIEINPAGLGEQEAR
jgi:polar amino acid transport system substrate-binding protein